MKIALLTILTEKDSIYVESFLQYSLYNKKYFQQNSDVDYFLFTNQKGKTSEEIFQIPCEIPLLPYSALLKNNIIHDYFEKSNKWNEYDFIFYIAPGLLIGDYYNFLQHEFFITHYEKKEKCNGTFYGGKSEYFKKFCYQFYNEINTIYTKKFPVPKHLDEHYLCIFYEENKNMFYHMMLSDANTSTFNNREDLEKIRKGKEKKLFLQQDKPQNKANKTFLINNRGIKNEYTINLEEAYLYNHYTYNLGRIFPINKNRYRIIWNKNPEIRQVLDLESLIISEFSL